MSLKHEEREMSFETVSIYDPDDPKLRDRMRKEMLESTPRYQRSRRFANTIAYLMRDFLPQDRECLERIDDYLMRLGFCSNAEVINVPPERDALDKLALEKRMLEVAMQPPVLPDWAKK
jgi:hypothetical protein